MRYLHLRFGMAGAFTAFAVQQFFMLFFVLGQTVVTWIQLTLLLTPTVLAIGGAIGKFAPKISGVYNPLNTFSLAFLVKLLAVITASWVDDYVLGNPIDANNLNLFRVYIVFSEIVVGMLLFLAIGWLENHIVKAMTR